MSVTVLQVQTKLKELGYYEGDLDNKGGTLTAAAVVEFQKANKIEPATGKLDPATLEALFPHKVEPPKTIQATFQDWILNGITSKTNWAAGAMVAAVVVWVNSRFGIQVPPDVEKAVTVLLVAVFGALIGVLRTRFDSPHVADRTPAVIQKPAEFK